MFQQTDMVKTDSFYVGTGEFPTLGIFFYIKQIRHIKPIDYACKFVLDKHFVMQYLQSLDMTSY